MTEGSPRKLLPRNAAAFRAGRNAYAPVAGNPVVARLESGVGNCFPGLECDLRNLERRFFPHLEVETSLETILEIASVDLPGVEAAVAAGALDAATAATYRRIAAELGAGSSWQVSRMEGDFGPLGRLSFEMRDLNSLSAGTGRLPTDAWTAVRLLAEDSRVTLGLVGGVGGGATLTLAGRRMRYLDADGALARIFEPGELTQSLCSPWTHDFRDCGCFYWASNHPDIALPALPAQPQPAEDRRWSHPTVWERSDRSVASPPIATAASPRAIEMRHHEINRDWQRLDFVLERRERRDPYMPGTFGAVPLPDEATLLRHLRYAAGVELAVMQEYLTAAWSLRDPSGLSEPLQGDLRAAFAELLRVAIGEMRHLRAVNDVLAALSPSGAFEPALAVATEVPDRAAGTFRPVQLRAATPEALDAFIAIEAPSLSVDGLYGPILATMERGIGDDEAEQAIRTVMAEGEDHWQTFLHIKEWLGRHGTSDCLRASDLRPPPPDDADHQELQRRYRALLETLRSGYAARLPAGATAINAARAAMLTPGGIAGALDAVARRGFLAVFDPIPASPFAGIGRP